MGSTHIPSLRARHAHGSRCHPWHATCFPLSTGSWRLPGLWCWGKNHGQLLGSEEGLAARGEC